MQDAFICDAVRTPFGRYAGALASLRADDLGAVPIRALIERNTKVDWAAIDDVVYGCANQAGEDNRNVARMSSLLAGLPIDVPGSTVNRLCGSSMDAIAVAARAIKSGEASLMIAGGVESMSRAPFVMGKADSAFSRSAQIHDTTIGWRFVNPLMKAKYGVDSMPEGRDVATDFVPAWTGCVAPVAAARGRSDEGRTPRRGVVGAILQGAMRRRRARRHPRADTTLESPSRSRRRQAGGTVTAGSAGVNGWILRGCSSRR
jgi:hypothetical protein